MLDTSKPTQLAVAGTFTGEPVRDSLDFWGTRFGWSLAVRFAPFNQVFQQLLDPGSMLAGNRSGVNVLLVRWDDLLPEGTGTTAERCAELLPRLAADLESAVRTAVQRGGAPHVVVMARSEAWTEPRRHVLEEDLAKRLEALEGVSAFTSAWIDDHYPVAGWRDAAADHVGRVPYTPEYFAALGTTIARAVHARRGRPCKVIVLDCDNTLWGGVCGEDGAGGVRLDGPYRALQRLMVAQADAGRLLCLCSKNVEADVRAVFARADMALPWSRIAAHRVNWESKADNLRSLAAELNLGLDSFAFIDDNPIECAAVRAAHPEVLTIQLPDTPGDIVATLDHVWAFDITSVTADDRRRGAMYRENTEREKARRGASTLGEFLASLDMHVGITDVPDAGVTRAAQMTQRTNQFNTTTVRRTEQDVRALLAAGALCVQVSLSDRFGDSGTVGLAVGTMVNGELDVDSLLLSCRALGRGVEHRLVAHIGERAVRAGASRVRFRFRRTDRNEPLQRFFEELASRHGADWDREGALVLAAAVAASVTFDPGAPAAGEIPADEERAGPVAADGAVATLQAIPVRWRRPADIWAAIRRTSRPRPDLQSTYVEPSSPLEQQIAAIWREVLRVDRVGLDDRFADLGGTSLTVVRVHGRLLSELGATVDITELFQHATVRALAAHLAGLGVARGGERAQSRADRQRAAFAALNGRAPHPQVRR